MHNLNDIITIKNKKYVYDAINDKLEVKNFIVYINDKLAEEIIDKDEANE